MSSCRSVSSASAASPWIISRRGLSLSGTAQGELTLTTATGAVWRGQGPLLVLHYYDRQHPRAQSVNIPWQEQVAFGTAGTPSLSAKCDLALEGQSDDEVRFLAQFSGIDIALRFSLRLVDGGFAVRFDESDLDERNASLYRALGIEVLPGFGAATTGETGYLILPNWSGCLMQYTRTVSREIRQTVFSSNDQWENCCNMPVFGIHRGQGTLCGLLTQGEYDAQLVCRAHYEDAHTNSIHPQFILRWQQQDDRIPGVREIAYRFAPATYEYGEPYVFCARVYREKLSAEGLRSWEEKGALHPEALQYRDRFFLKIFMGYKEPRADGKGTFHATCTFDEARAILEDCLARGMKKICAILVGWNQDGHDGMPPQRFPVDERLGGEAALLRLNGWCRENDILLGVHDSYGASYTCSPEFDLNDVIRHRTGEPWASVIWSGGQCHRTCPKVYVEKNVPRDMDRLSALGLRGHHHIDAVGSFMPCYHPDHPLTGRREYIEYNRRMFGYAVRTFGSVSTEMPFGAYFADIDGMFHSYTHPSPWHLNSEAGRWFYDRSVPLLPIVVRGSVQCMENGQKDASPRDFADWGLVPQFEVAARPSPSFGIPVYCDHADRLQQMYAKFYGDEGVLTKVGHGAIAGRWEHADGSTETRYENGITLRREVDGTIRICAPETARA